MVRRSQKLPASPIRRVSRAFMAAATRSRASLHHIASRSKGASRRTIAGALICTLVLQGILLAVATGWLAAASANPDWAGVVICHHDDAGSSQPVVPANPLNPDDNGCCLYCVVSALYVPPTPIHAASYRAVVIAYAEWPLPTWRLPAKTIDANVRPRGPPRIA
jgi:hypothetical protein